MVEINVNGKATIYSTAIIAALSVTAQETGGPDINAAIAALADAQAHLIASIKDRPARRAAERQALEALSKKVAEKVNARLLAEGKVTI